MTTDWRKYWWQPSFTAAFFAVGVPYWLIPYNRLNLPDAVLGAGLLIVVATSALVRSYSGRSFWRVVAVMGSAVPAVVMVRVIGDTIQDSTPHNLWPFEIAIATFVGAAAALTGALLGSMVLRLWRQG